MRGGSQVRRAAGGARSRQAGCDHRAEHVAGLADRSRARRPFRRRRLRHGCGRRNSQHHSARRRRARPAARTYNHGARVLARPTSIALAYSIEQKMKARRPPQFTPHWDSDAAGSELKKRTYLGCGTARRGSVGASRCRCAREPVCTFRPRDRERLIANA